MPQLLIALAVLIASTTTAQGGKSHAPAPLVLREIVSCEPEALRVKVGSADGTRSETREFTMVNGNLSGVRVVDDQTGESAEVVLERIGAGDAKPVVTRSSCPISAMMVSQPDLFADWTQYSVFCMTAKSNVAALPYNAPVQYYWH